MSKIILKFDAVEEQREAQYAIDGLKWAMVVTDILQDLRQTVKHEASLISRGGKATPEEIKVCNAIRERIFEYLQNDNLSLD